MADPLVSDIFRLFINRVDCHLGWHDRWVLKRSPISKQMIEAALAGKCCIGVQAVSGSGTARWTCFDADTDAQVPQLLELARLVPVESRLFELSRRGAHLWVFHSVVPWDAAAAEGHRLAESVVLKDIEIYPKHAGLHAVRLVGTRHPKSGMTYPVIDVESGEVVELSEALSAITPASFEVTHRAESSQRVNVRPFMSVESFDQLVQTLQPLTEVMVYAPGKASGKCPWHNDVHPSLYVKGKRFHCFACGVWGDAADVRRYLKSGTRPSTS